MDVMQRFHDRPEAGQLLARRLAPYQDRDDVVVLALPRGGVVAVRVAASDACREFQSEVDDVVCLQTPRDFGAVGRWYDDFSQTTDEEVRELLSDDTTRQESSGCTHV